jgi:hypothetical protein
MASSSSVIGRPRYLCRIDDLYEAAHTADAAWVEAVRLLGDSSHDQRRIALDECYRTYAMTQEAAFTAVREGPSYLAQRPHLCHTCRKGVASGRLDDWLRTRPCWCRSGPDVWCHPFPEPVIQGFASDYHRRMAKWIVIPAEVDQLSRCDTSDSSDDTLPFFGTRDVFTLERLRWHTHGSCEAVFLRRFTCDFTGFATKIQRVWRRYKTHQVLALLSECTPIAQDVIAAVIVPCLVVVVVVPINSTTSRD